MFVCVRVSDDDTRISKTVLPTFGNIPTGIPPGTRLAKVTEPFAGVLGSI